MNISQGIYRLAQVIKWAGRIFGGIWTVGLVYGLITKSTESGLNSDFFFFQLLACAFIAITEGIAWVLEGFSND